ncbi:unnamed protein product [Parascedosporium putredinis]|uniref:Uncharacterized protein n=1 Tax=Parascedosporium putredinis TaxID=1442378 RepID=A0A9P1HA21_9PEZI|nr:unnamed protein product [Parascedosporium putredinis]CAI8000804.1 unnamed protein product [Parascedosporium putredinis]
MFLAQVVSTTLSCFIQIMVLNGALNNIEGVCTLEQPESLLGAILLFGLGAIVPIIIYYAGKRWPNSIAKHLMAPLIFGGAGMIPPASPLNYLTWGMVGYLFQYRIRSRHFAWWSRLNFLTSSSLDLGLALATLVVFFAFTLRSIDPPPGGE